MVTADAMPQEVTSPTILFDMPAATLQVVQSSELVENTWPARADVEPQLEQNADGLYMLSLRNQGVHGKFELPYIGSTVVYVDEELLAVLVAFHGTDTIKLRRPTRYVVSSKGQFWRFYQKIDDGVWQRVEWRHLNDELRQVVLQACSEKAPEWAREPGKLRAEYASPKRSSGKRVTTISYKLVQVRDGRYFSIYKGDEEYHLGEWKHELARPNHRGGYYSYPHPEQVVELFQSRKLFPRNAYQEPLQVALLECEIKGKVIEYDNGKWSSTYLRPIRELSRFSYVPNSL
jgi:hypothetical protein